MAEAIIHQFPVDFCVPNHILYTLPSSASCLCKLTPNLQLTIIRLLTVTPVLWRPKSLSVITGSTLIALLRSPSQSSMVCLVSMFTANRNGSFLWPNSKMFGKISINWSPQWYRLCRLGLRFLQRLQRTRIKKLGLINSLVRSRNWPRGWTWQSRHV